MYTSCNYFKICAHIVSNMYKYCTVTDAGCVLRVQTYVCAYATYDAIENVIEVIDDCGRGW